MAADGIALSPDGGTLFYTPLSSRHLYSVPTALLRDPKLSEAELAAAWRWTPTGGCMPATTSTTPSMPATRRGDGRRWCTTRASCGRIRCRWGRTAICISPPTSCIDRPASMVEWIAGRRRTCCIAPGW
ncbi:L-dopachrome tautomerase-related protein, partial [Klebsiella pneumoniae]|uniref:L-dopachrome tautomerase-related protein n=1 Tax=Klebsiella pneumoniae TaxID=573 RepID=UPI0037BE2D6D